MGHPRRQVTLRGLRGDELHFLDIAPVEGAALLEVAQSFECVLIPLAGILLVLGISSLFPQQGVGCALWYAAWRLN